MYIGYGPVCVYVWRLNEEVEYIYNIYIVVSLVWCVFRLQHVVHIAAIRLRNLI